MKMFADVEESFIKMLANRVHRLYFLKGDYVIRKDDVGTDVYFIQKGKYKPLYPQERTSLFQRSTCPVYVSIVRVTV